jgi:hypothetical protein
MNVSDGIKEAADRLFAWATRHIDAPERNNPVVRALVDDSYQVAQAYLVREAAEKERAEEFDAEWLRRVGFQPDDEDDEFHSIVRFHQLSVCLDDLHGATSWCLRGAAVMVDIRTKGQVIDLFSGLGRKLAFK